MAYGIVCYSIRYFLNRTNPYRDIPGAFLQGGLQTRMCIFFANIPILEREFVQESSPLHQILYYQILCRGEATWISAGDHSRREAVRRIPPPARLTS
jgi:hypothetical protein